MLRSSLFAFALLAAKTNAYQSNQIDDVIDPLTIQPIELNGFDLSSAHTVGDGYHHDYKEDFPATYDQPTAHLNDPLTGWADGVSQSNKALQSDPPNIPASYLLDADDDKFSVVRLTAAAPWGVRIQPGLQYRQSRVTYVQHSTGITIKADEGALHMFEGGYTQYYDNTPMIENDVWISADDATWDLVAGRSIFGRSGNVYASNRNTFTGRRGSVNCADPISDIVLSLGGMLPSNNENTNQAWYSLNGVDWIQRSTFDSFTPGRHFSSCDIDEKGHAFLIGGHAENKTAGVHYLLDDVWISNALWAYNGWRRVTDHAPFGPREEHLVLVANSTILKTEIIYVIGGKVKCMTDQRVDCYDGTNANDVWASSDSAKTWTKLPTAPWAPRWGHGGVVTRSGVLIVFGGVDSMTGRWADSYTHRDIWASFDGGLSWKQCQSNTTDWIRGESSAVINSEGKLVIAAGYVVTSGSVSTYNDIWRSTFSVENVHDLAQHCGGPSVIPAAGVGLRQWPGSTPETNVISFSPVTFRGPWSPRIQPAFFLQVHPRTYTNPNDGTVASTGPNWLLMYEGSLTADTTNENDVYASADNGQTWTLISGISLRGLYGHKESANPHTSFDPRGAAVNCEDPQNDDVYSIAGIKYVQNGNQVVPEDSSDVWYSSDAINWTKRTNNARWFSPGRYFASCDVDNKHNIYLIGGETVSGTYLNDVWKSTDRGKNWQFVTKASFPARSEHAVQVVHSKRYNVDLIYVMGGYTRLSNGAISVLNDVWVSSDAQKWKQIRSGTSWSARWGHGAFVTEAGLLAVLGGTDAQNSSPEDFWVSADGGKSWSECKLPKNGGIIRGEQGVVLTEDERLLVGNGYKYYINPSYRTEYSDLYISDFSFKDPKSAQLRAACPTLKIPSGGVGYVDASWEPDDPDPDCDPDWDPDCDDPDYTQSSSSTGRTGDSSGSIGLSTTALIGIIVAVVLVLCVGFYAYRHHAQTGSWNIFNNEAPRPDVGNVDLTALYSDSDSSLSHLEPSVSTTQSATQMSNL